MSTDLFGSSVIFQTGFIPPVNRNLDAVEPSLRNCFLAISQIHLPHIILASLIHANVHFAVPFPKLKMKQDPNAAV